MERRLTRREFAGWAGLAALTLRIPMGRVASTAAPVVASPSLRIVHLSDFHWGYTGAWNRNVAGSLERALAQAAALSPGPDLLVVTGDLIQATSQEKERERRFGAVKERLNALKVPWMAVPGEHDAFGDMGRGFERHIGPLHFHRVFRGIHVLGLDNVSRGYFLGRDQLAWLKGQIRRLKDTDRVLVLSHAPLFTLFEPWNWATYDGSDALRALERFSSRQVLFGHIHQSLDRTEHGVANHAGLPTSWPLPEPGPLEKLEPWPQGGTHPDMGLGFRVLDLQDGRFRESSVLLEASRKAARS